MFKKLTAALLTTGLLLSSIPAYAATWHQTSSDTTQTMYVDTDSIRYAKDAAGHTDRNTITFWSKTNYTKSLLVEGQPGGTMLSFCSLHSDKHTQQVFSYTYTDAFGSLSGADTSGGAPIHMDEHPEMKAVYDYITTYCKTNDVLISSNAGKAVEPPVAPAAKPQTQSLQSVPSDDHTDDPGDML